MRRLITAMMAVLLGIGLSQTAQAIEYYLEVSVPSPSAITALGRVVSIDRVAETTVRVYANDEQRQRLDELGYTYSALPHPGTLIVPAMSSTARDAKAWDTYPTYPAYVAMMNQFAADYPGLCTIVTMDSTVNGRKLHFARISANVGVDEDEPEVLYTSSMHGDETTGYVLLLRLIDHLLTNYGTDPTVTHLVDNLEIWINPLANPDGTYAAGESTVFGATRYNANAADLNRNFPDPDDGPHPDGLNWQPETLAMMEFAETHHIVLSANFHGGAEVVNYPWDTWWRRHPDDVWFQDLSRDYADLAQANSLPGYMTDLNNGITNGWDWYTISGGRQDYMTYGKGGRETTIELSATKLVSGAMLPAYWDYNKNALLDYLGKALFGVRGIVTDAVTGDPLAATVSVLSHDADSSEARTDPAIGDYHRMLAPGTYDLRFTAAGYPSLTVNNVIVSDSQVTIVDAALGQICSCPHQGDSDLDGLATAIDLGAVIDALFLGGSNPQDPDCPAARFDLDCDGATTAQDMALIIDQVFFSGPPPCDPCIP